MKSSRDGECQASRTAVKQKPQPNQKHDHETCIQYHTCVKQENREAIQQAQRGQKEEQHHERIGQAFSQKQISEALNSVSQEENVK
jgi:hypothetical protein